MTIVLDYFFNKNLKILNIPDEISKDLKHGDKISYFLEEKGVEKESIGTVLWYSIPLEEKTAQFSKKLNPEENCYFLKQQ